MDLRRLPQKAAAELLSTTSRTMRDWEANGESVPRNEDGTYPGPALVAWYAERTTETLDATRERARKDKEMADKLALENRVRRGELVEAAAVEESWASIVVAARARLIQIPDAIGQFCDARYAPIVTAEARKRVYEALSDLAGEGYGAVGPATDADGERVGRLKPKTIERGKRRAGAMAN